MKAVSILLVFLTLVGALATGVHAQPSPVEQPAAPGAGERIVVFEIFTRAI